MVNGTKYVHKKSIPIGPPPFCFQYTRENGNCSGYQVICGDSFSTAVTGEMFYFPNNCASDAGLSKFAKTEFAQRYEAYKLEHGSK
ncbi:unnamed protein product [Caenorhabditis auriculariae]|uniref:Uncharacterized protein n=1 Tax=Caenorhabditis auriculariae TaxID=2777116 RepID=A0A8S1HXP3_9PELO|nr:unnamed protein product [Caenorhabditis auriculariae]